ncbi:hypothetical protein F5Y19DRAFT_100043 [Xylariaceae sp. FL1651]|nr:hypothetical protein F5Y19DRAFT_100043 [Xylariaceae sp. FL1651]
MNNALVCSTPSVSRNALVKQVYSGANFYLDKIKISFPSLNAQRLLETQLQCLSLMDYHSRSSAGLDPPVVPIGGKNLKSNTSELAHRRSRSKVSIYRTPISKSHTHAHIKRVRVKPDLFSARRAASKQASKRAKRSPFFPPPRPARLQGPTGPYTHVGWDTADSCDIARSAGAQRLLCMRTKRPGHVSLRRLQGKGEGCRRRGADPVILLAKTNNVREWATGRFRPIPLAKAAHALSLPLSRYKGR